MAEPLAVVVMAAHESNTIRATILDEELAAYVVQRELEAGIPEEFRQHYFLTRISTEGV